MTLIQETSAILYKRVATGVTAHPRVLQKRNITSWSGCPPYRGECSFHEFRNVCVCVIREWLHAMAASQQFKTWSAPPQNLLHTKRFECRPNLPIGGYGSPLHFSLRVCHPLRRRIPFSPPEEAVDPPKAHRLAA